MGTVPTSFTWAVQPSNTKAYDPFMRYFVAAAIAPFVMLLLKALALWAVRRFAPRLEPAVRAD